MTEPTPKLTLGVLISGNGSNLQAILDACADGSLDARVSVVISNRRHAKGLERARAAGVRAVTLDARHYPDSEAFNRALLGELEHHQVDYVVMAGYMRLLGSHVLDAFPQRVLNLHPALLPAFPGAHAIRDAFEAGVTQTGVTVHIANESFDEGPVIAQESVPVLPDDTLETLEERVHSVEHRLYPQVLQWIAEGRVQVHGEKVELLMKNPPNPPIKRALVSVTDKSGIVDFCRALVAEFGVEIISTGGTARVLQEGGIAVVPIDALTGFPELMDGRVKTLHPKVHGGLLARRDVAAHLAAAREHDIRLIDLVVVNLYAFADTVARRGVSEEEAIEQIDIGGPSMLRSAAKNCASVTVVPSPAHYEALLAELHEQGGATTLATRRALARETFATTARYDAGIAEYLASRESSEAGGTAAAAAAAAGASTGAAALPQTLSIELERVQQLRYGENPHQQAAFYRRVGAAPHTLARAQQLQGKELSYNNILDTDAAWAAVREFSEPACVIVKHTNPCGAAVRTELCAAYQAAWEGDPVSAYGGIIACNRVVDASVVAAIAANKQFVEVIIAPDFDSEARALLSAKPNLRVLATAGVNPPAPPAGASAGSDQATSLALRSVEGGVLLQEEDAASENPASFTVAGLHEPSAEQRRQLLFAWKLAKSVKSNAIVVARDERLVGSGAGQPNRVNSARIAVEQAEELAAGAVAASDAFVPFPDTVEVLAAAGITALIQPGGSIRDEEVVAAADAAGVVMLFTATRHFRH
jgi:phosphoribosylaminoimidazolecarboxamide formyltransferase/IMP cyclohydrolase